MLDNIRLRGLLSPFGHIAWTAIAAAALWRARAGGGPLLPSLAEKRFLILFAVPVGLHFIWNLPFSGPFMIKYLLLGFVAYVVIFSLVQTGLGEVRESALARAATPGAAAAGPGAGAPTSIADATTHSATLAAPASDRPGSDGSTGGRPPVPRDGLAFGGAPPAQEKDGLTGSPGAT
jgi:hypothetical protein